MWAKKNKLLISALFIGILAYLMPTSEVFAHNSEVHIDFLLENHTDTNLIKQEVLAIDSGAVIEEIPEIQLLRVTSSSENIEEVKKNKSIEMCGKLADIFIEDKRVINQNYLLKKTMLPENLASENRMDDLAILDELAWYKDTMLGDTQVLEKSGGQGVKIGLIDSGIDILHPLLSPVVDLTKAKSFIDTDSSIVDHNGHGTMVAGIIAQLAPQAKITPYRVLSAESGESFWTLEAMIQAVNDGQDMLNMSLGTYKYGNIEDERITIESFERAVDYALQNEVIIVSSSGNKGLDLDLEFKNTELRHLPGSILGVVSTSALTLNHTLASYSNIGSNIQHTAPGGDYVFSEGILDISYLIYTAYPTILDNGLGDLGIPQGYMFSAGTSLSAPCISGIIADYMTYYKKMRGSSPTVEQVKKDLATASTNLGIPGKNKFYGYGLPKIADTFKLISDTVPPIGRFKELVVEVNEPKRAEEFIVDIKDNSDSEVKASYINEPNFTKLGSQEIQVRLEDSSGNQTDLAGMVTIIDTKAPTATLKNVKVVKGKQLQPEMFLEKIIDNHDSTKVIAAFVKPVSTEQIGKKQVEIRLSDPSGNSIILTGELEVVEAIVKEKAIDSTKQTISVITTPKKEEILTMPSSNKTINSAKQLPNTSERVAPLSMLGYWILGGTIYMISQCHGSKKR